MSWNLKPSAWIVCLALSAAALAAPVGAEEVRDKAPSGIDAWWRDARFGLFVHWGPVSIVGTEIGWSRGGERRGTGGTGEIPLDVYDNLYKRFNPTKFVARQWVALAKEAGMRYLVFTTRHHDGFSMFDTKLSDYKITRSPFGRDVVAELAEACHEAGLRLGFYHSPPDWHHPDYRTENHARFVEYLHGQVRELCTNYGKVDIFWFDGLGGTAKDWDAERLLKMIRELQPGIVINNRAGLSADHDTPEQEIGKFQSDRPWESCITICQQWAWKPNDALKSLKECIQTLARCAGGDGNLLLNVGPMPTGEIEPRQVERLKEIGAWLKQNGESIYGTRGGPFLPGAWGASTRRGDRVYLHIMKWDDDRLILPPIDRSIIVSSVLTGGTSTVKKTARGIEVSVPAKDRREVDTIVVLHLDGSALGVKPVKIPSASVASGGKATASNVFQGQAGYGADKAFDDDEGTRWATDGGTHEAWLQVNLGEPRTFARALILEEYDRVQEFELQVQEGSQWRTFHKGTRIGSRLPLEFAPVTGQVIRLNILRATDGPTIWELQLLPPAK